MDTPALPAQLKSIDLFSGVGGIARAFSGICQSLAYCDIAQDAQTVIRNNITKGNLEPARIVDDVRKLADPDSLGGDHPDIICAGFPCTGASPLGKRDGFRNKQTGTGLFFELVKVIKAHQPRMVFMENVPCIIKWLRDISKQLNKCGYDFWYCINGGHAVGAPQQRKRWFCLAVRRDVQELEINATGYTRHSWGAGTEPRVRLCPGTDDRRISLMGNSVLPCVVRQSFLYLFTGCRTLPTDLNPGVIRLSRPLKLQRCPHTKGSYPQAGVCLSGCVYATSPMPKVHKVTIDVTLDPSVWVHESRNPITSPVITEPTKIQNWSTPRHGGVGVSHTLTKRCSRDIGTQLRYATCTPDEQRGGRVNPVWIEWLMGFPAGWTELDVAADKAAEPAEAQAEAEPVKVAHEAAAEVVEAIEAVA